MPDVRMPDGTIIRGVPDGTSQEQLLAQLAQSRGQTQSPLSQGNLAAMNMSWRDPSLPKGIENTKSLTPNDPLSTAARGALQGATFNMADEGMAAAESVFTKKTYDEALKDQRDQYELDSTTNPVSDIAGNVAGTIAGPGKFIKPAKGFISAMRQGAIAGGIYGFGQGEGGLKNRAISGTEGAGIGLGTGALTQAGVRALDKVRPKNVVANYVNDQFTKSGMAKESEDLSKNIGQLYTPGQATGSKGLLTVEGLLRRHPVTADKMADFEAKQLDTSLRNLQTNLDNLHANPAGPEATGGAVAKAFDQVFKNVTKIRRDAAKVDFDKVDELAGNYRVIKPTTLKAEIEEIAKSYDVPGGGDASARLVNQIRGIAADLDRAGSKGLTANETGRLLEVYGNAARGTGKIFADLETSQQRGIARKLQQAVMKDLDAAADSDNMHIGRIADALKTARNNYKTNSKAINDLEESVVGRLFGGDYKKAPERIAESMRKMKPSELRQSMEILDKGDPTTSQIVKRHLVEDALERAGQVSKSSSVPQGKIAGEEMFSPQKFLTAIRKSNVWEAFSPVERRNMEMAMRDLERISYRAGTDGSPTAPLLFVEKLLSSPLSGTATGAIGGAGIAAAGGGDWKEGAMAGAAAGRFSGAAIPRLAKLITDPVGQQALRTLKVSKPNTPAMLAAISTLTAIVSGNSETDQIEEKPEQMGQHPTQ